MVEVVVERGVGGGGARSGRLTLKTTDMETNYDMGTKMIDSLLKEKVSLTKIRLCEIRKYEIRSFKYGAPCNIYNKIGRIRSLLVLA